jgi:C4-dicarboxylate-specific signal transduction histidine kinase
MIFGEERDWVRSPFTNEKIQLAVAISRQVSVGINLWWCYERLTNARHDLQVSHDKVVKAERLSALGEVTRAVEHEINNPLNVIVNWAEIYREDDAIDPELRKKFQVIFDMAMRIRDVVKKLTEAKEAKSVEFIKGQKMTDIG